MSEQETGSESQQCDLRVGKDRVVRVKYVLTDLEKGETLAYRDDLYYLHGGYDGAPKKIEAALEGRRIGDRVQVDLTPKDGYGEVDPHLIITQAAENFPPEGREPGAQLDAEAPDGSIIHFTVTEVKDGMVTVNGNHPLAGRHLRFDMEILEIRPANEMELAARRAMPPSVEEAFAQFQ